MTDDRDTQSIRCLVVLDRWWKFVCTECARINECEKRSHYLESVIFLDSRDDFFISIRISIDFFVVIDSRQTSDKRQSEICRTSLDIAESFSRNIDSSNLKVSNIVEEKRVRKSKKIANRAVVSSLDIYSSLDISLIDIVVSKNANSNEIKNIYSRFAVITRSTRLHRDSLSLFSKLWRDMLRHSHAKDFQKATEFEYQTLIKISIFTEIF
jgi:hypothetical protein